MTIQARTGNPYLLVVGALIALTAGVTPVVMFTFGIFLKPMAADLAWSRSTLSAALLVATLASLLGAPLMGWLVDRFGVYRVVAPAIVFLAAALASLAWTRVGYAFFLAFAVMGIAGVTHSPLAYGRAISRRFIEHRGKALGFATAGIGIGAAIMPGIAQHAIDLYGWRSAYLVLAGIVLVIGLLGLQIFHMGESRDAPAGFADKMHADNGKLGIVDFLKDRRFNALLFCFFLIGAGINGTMSHLSAILSDRNIGTGVSAAAASAAGLSMIIGRIVCGFMLDKFRPHSVANIFVAAPLIGIMMFAFSSNPITLLAGCILVGVGLGAEADLLSYFTAYYFPREKFSEISGYFLSAFTLGIGAGTIGLARSFDFTGSYQDGLVGLAVALAILCTIFWSLGQKPRVGSATASDTRL